MGKKNNALKLGIYCADRSFLEIAILCPPVSSVFSRVSHLDTPHLFQKQIWTESSKKRNSPRIKQGQNSEAKPQQSSACSQLIARHTSNIGIFSAGRAPTFQPTSIPTSPTLETPLFPPLLKSVNVPTGTHHQIRAFQIPSTKSASNSIPCSHIDSNFGAEIQWPHSWL